MAELRVVSCALAFQSHLGSKSQVSTTVLKASAEHANIQVTTLIHADEIIANGIIGQRLFQVVPHQKLTTTR